MMKTAFLSGLFSYLIMEDVKWIGNHDKSSENGRRFYNMKRFPSVKKNSEFQRAYQTGRSFASSALVMYVCKNEVKHNRLGVSCSKKIGNSVVRHTFARKMREIFRLNDFRVKQGFDIIVVIRGRANHCTYQQIEAQYLNLLNRHHIIIKDVEAAQPIPSQASK